MNKTIMKIFAVFLTLSLFGGSVVAQTTVEKIENLRAGFEQDIDNIFSVIDYIEQVKVGEVRGELDQAADHVIGNIDHIEQIKVGEIRDGLDQRVDYVMGNIDVAEQDAIKVRDNLDQQAANLIVQFPMIDFSKGNPNPVEISPFTPARDFLKHMPTVTNPTDEIYKDVVDEMLSLPLENPTDEIYKDVVDELSKIPVSNPTEQILIGARLQNKQIIQYYSNVRQPKTFGEPVYLGSLINREPRQLSKWSVR